MECNPGMKDITKDDCIILQKCFYCLVQAVRQNIKNADEILKKIGFTRGNVDPCLYMKQSTNGKVNVGFFIDDNVTVVNPETIDDGTTLRKWVSLKSHQSASGFVVL